MLNFCNLVIAIWMLLEELNDKRDIVIKISYLSPVGVVADHQVT